MFVRPVRGVPGRGGDTMRGGTATKRGGRKRASISLVAAAILIGGALAFVAAPAAKAANPGDLAGPDPAGDTGDAHADITAFSMAYGSSIIVTERVVAGSNPSTGQFLALWGLDTNGDGHPEFVAGTDGATADAAVVKVSDQSLACDATGGWDGGGLYSAAFPPSCIGSPANLWVQAASHFQPDPNDDTNFFEDVAPDGGFVGPTSPPRAVNTAGIVGDDWGGLHGYHEGSGAVPTASGGPYWRGQNVARGVSAFPGGGGVEADDWGGLHPFSINGSPTPGAPHGGPYWPGQDVVRGVALTSDGGGGFEVDDWGGLHPFSLGSGTAPAAPNNVAFWPGQDVARGVVILADGTGGFTVDLWGGLHPFGIGANQPPPKPTGGPYWVGQDAARGIALLSDGSGGFIGDSWGGFHGFAIDNQNIPAGPG